MHKNILLNIVLVASLAVIVSSDKLSIPDNYTWPLNTKNFCFAARFNLTIDVQYEKDDNSTVQTTIPLDNSTFQSYSVSCGYPDNVHQLFITMFDGLSSLIFTFTVNSSKTVSLTKVSGYFLVNERQTYISNYSMSTAGLHKFSSTGSYFPSASDHSYKCDSDTQIKDFQSNGTLTIKSINMGDLQIQAFSDATQEFSEYATATLCNADADKDSNVIPIIVGACLAALVVIVLVAYIIGRQRARTGYQSV